MYLKISRLLLGQIVLTLAACEGPVKPPITTSLTALFPYAEIQTETSNIDLWTQDTSSALFEGWSASHNDEGEWFCWGTGNRSALRLIILSPRARKLVLKGVPFLYENAPRQIVEVLLNGVPIDTLRLHSSWEPMEYRVSLPAKFQVIGENLLELCYAYNRRPSEAIPGSNDSRPLAVMWTSMYIDGVYASASPLVDTTSVGPVLILPFNTAVNYYIKSPQGGRLTIEDVRFWGEDGTGSHEAVSRVLWIAITSADRSDRPEVHMVTVTEDTGGRSLRLPSTGGGPIRISLTAIPQGQRPQSIVGISLLRPTVHTHTPPLGEPDQKAEDGSFADRGPTASRHGLPNILIYLVDALRADHLGCYGYPRPTSPNIDAFAEEATLFTTTVAQSSWTRPSVASIFTGLYGHVHGAIGGLHVLLDCIVVLPEILRDLGYSTAGLTSNGVVDSIFGFGQGFDSYELTACRSSELNSSFFRWLEERKQDRPFFFYLHTMDPHAPYSPPLRNRQRFAPSVVDTTVGSVEMVQALTKKEIEGTPTMAKDLIALYDAEVASNDEAFGALIKKLKDLNIYDSTLIVFLSDHGEEFLDHGQWQHGQTLYSEQLRVPLIIKFAHGFGAGRRVSSIARQIDVLPTLLDYLDESIPQEVQGRSLLPLLYHPGASQKQVDALAFLKFDRFDVEVQAVVSEGMKFIRHLKFLPGRPVFELYDTVRDSLETENLIGQRPIWAGYLLSLLKYKMEEHGEVAIESEEARFDGWELAEELRQHLRDLGYIE